MLSRFFESIDIVITVVIPLLGIGSGSEIHPVDISNQL
jgi:hypothetical protein